MLPSGRPNESSIGELIARTLEPALRRRGIANVELLRWWPEIVGAEFADVTRPERIKWPRGDGAAVLFVQCDPAAAVPLSYEREKVRERLNAFLGYPAIADVRIVRRPIAAISPAKVEAPAPEANEIAALELRLSSLDPDLRDSLLALGRSVLARS